MKIKDIIKKQTTIIAIAVILITIAVIGISYALFFQVNTNQVNQTITAGTLKLNVSFTPSTNAAIEPITTAEGLVSEAISYTVQNTDSNLPANYTLYIGGTTSNTIDLSLVKYSIDGSTSALVTSGTSISENNTTYYQFDSGSLAAGASSTAKSLRVWVDEDLVTDEISSAVLDLELYIVSEVNESSS